MKKGSTKFSLDDLSKMGLSKNKDGSYSKNGLISHSADKKNQIFVPDFAPQKVDSIFLQINKFEYRLELKPMSVNTAWQGKRFKTENYKSYEIAALSMLPIKKIPIPPYRLTLEFGFSNKASDLDNPAKLFIDILQKKYKFNDKEIYELNIKKVIVEKRKEYCKFNLETIKN